MNTYNLDNKRLQKNLSNVNIYFIGIFFVLYIVTFIAGCKSLSSSSNLPSGSTEYIYYNRYGAPAIISYIEKYGNDYETKRTIENGKIYETMTWYSKGVSIKYLYETGQIIKEEHFSTYSSR